MEVTAISQEDNNPVQHPSQPMIATDNSATLHIGASLNPLPMQATPPANLWVILTLKGAASADGKVSTAMPKSVH